MDQEREDLKSFISFVPRSDTMLGELETQLGYRLSLAEALSEHRQHKERVAESVSKRGPRRRFAWVFPSRKGRTHCLLSAPPLRGGVTGCSRPRAHRPNAEGFHTTRQ